MGEDDWTYVVSMVQSRALDLQIHGDSRLSLVPVIDLLNHRSADPSCTVRYNADEKAFDLVACAPITAGDELFIKYGAKSNAELLANYGFAVAGNPHDVVHVAVPMDAGGGGSMVQMQKLAFLPSALARAASSAMGSQLVGDIMWDEDGSSPRLAPPTVVLLRLASVSPERLFADASRLLDGRPLLDADEEDGAVWALLQTQCQAALEEVEATAAPAGVSSLDTLDACAARLLKAAISAAQRATASAVASREPAT